MMVKLVTRVTKNKNDANRHTNTSKLTTCYRKLKNMKWVFMKRF